MPGEINRDKNQYTPLIIGDIVKNYNEKDNTLFCYKIGDFGFYNSSEIIPNNYFWVKNYFNEEQFPLLFSESKNNIIKQTSDFVITELNTWNNEKDFISQYYQPYTNEVKTSTFVYQALLGTDYIPLEFILLIRNNYSMQ